MQPAGRKQFRAPLGDVSNSNALDSQNVGSIELKMQREKIRNASMTNDQRNERNKKRHEAYKRKKADTSNK
ncbi:hypothetical protein PVAP13_2NG061879 [Panicum virgatum]|uniref:Uncharacterized protein n=1 Tax=Panicum virgatum TaxID=38727 RepID=A0A8T0VID5_PANVG|nr:hypothetical protein PVAP13_2NG061879 [Panicum virgatum]